MATVAGIPSNQIKASAKTATQSKPTSKRCNIYNIKLSRSWKKFRSQNCVETEAQAWSTHERRTRSLIVAILEDSWKSSYQNMAMDGFKKNNDLTEKSPEGLTSRTHPEAHVLVGVTGSVAALKLPFLVSGLLQIPGVQVQVVSTEKAKHFYDVRGICVPLFSDEDEWKMWTQRSDPVLHIELRRWADVMLIAPLDANTLGKISSGISDNLLTCVVRAWDLKKPLLFCPAMNTAMWNHPITAKQIDCLCSFGYTEIPCIEKTLVCGDKGLGAMAEVDTIIEKVREVLSKQQL